MEVRYTRIFMLPKMLHSEGSPVTIAAGALLKDNVTGNFLGQLKLCNISQKQIKQVKVKLHAYDASGAAVEGVAGFLYEDLSVDPGTEFGADVPIAMLDASVRSFAVEILRVVYADGQVFIGNGEIAAPASESIAEKLQNINEEKQKAAQSLRRVKKVLKLCIIPCLFAVISAIMFFYCSDDAFYSLSIDEINEMTPHQLWKYERQYTISTYYPAFVGAFISAIVCAVASCKGIHRRAWFMVGTIVSVALLVLQLTGHMFLENWWPGRAIVEFIEWPNMTPSHGDFAAYAMTGGICLLGTHLLSGALMIYGLVANKPQKESE